jgi:hypothetical protein
MFALKYLEIIKLIKENQKKDLRPVFYITDQIHGSIILINLNSKSDSLSNKKI